MFLVGMVLLSVYVGRGPCQVVRVPGGTFTMGSNDGVPDERPEHSVTLESFSIDAFEVTEARYDSCVASGKCTSAHYDDSTCRAWNGRRFVRVRVPAAARHPDNPVVCVTWYQARQYCQSKGMKLPNEIQWEYAARATATGRYPWGDVAPTAQRCIISRKNGPEKAGSCPANSWGLYDMIGNVWEWLSDYYRPVEYGDGHSGNSAGPPVGLYRVIRGGGWYSIPEQVSVSDRQWYSPSFSEVSIGFRCVGR